MASNNSKVPVLLVLGKRGSGKSTLCNRLAGEEATSDSFPVSTSFGMEACTQRTVLATVKFGGDMDKDVAVIDTKGFGEENNETSSELFETMVSKYEFVSFFGITLNGLSTRLDISNLEMFREVEDMFGSTFWNQCVFIFTKLSMSDKERKRRLKLFGCSDQAYAENYVKSLETRFPQARNVHFVFLDACYDSTDPSSKALFKDSMKKLYNLLISAEDYPVISRASSRASRLTMISKLGGSWSASSGPGGAGLYWPKPTVENIR